MAAVRHMSLGSGGATKKLLSLKRRISNEAVRLRRDYTLSTVTWACVGEKMSLKTT